MRGATVYRVYGVHAGRTKDNYFGTFRTRAEADLEVAKLLAREMHGANWAARYHDQGFAIREHTVTTDWESPSRPKPRDRYFLRSQQPAQPDGWTHAEVAVFERTPTGLAEEPCARWSRDYAMLRSFEPFRQGDRVLALMSRDYTRSAVIDLRTGDVIAEEDESYYQNDPSKPGAGFCPVGFYVPDWWDVHDDSIIPGSEHWDERLEWPAGDFGFVWGCHWGDDRSWKVHLLDLRDVQRGVLRREERFGYVALATEGWTSPCFDEGRALDDPPSKPPPFLSVSWCGEAPSIALRTELTYDLRSGALDAEQRECLLRGPG